jgi:hypothetical protein
MDPIPCKSIGRSVAVAPETSSFDELHEHEQLEDMLLQAKNISLDQVTETLLAHPKCLVSASHHGNCIHMQPM